MTRKIVTVDESLRLPPAVESALKADLDTEFGAYVSQASVAASQAQSEANAAEAYRNQAQQAAEEAQAPTAEMLNDILLDGMSEPRQTLNDLYQSKMVLNAKDFGVVGDGITDDSVALQSAVDAAFDAGGGVVYLPSGRYLVTQTPTTPTVTVIVMGPPIAEQEIDLPMGLVLRSGVSLIGSGPHTTQIVSETGGVDSVVGCVDYESGVIANLSLVGPGATGNAMHGLGFYATAPRINRDVTIQNVEISFVGSYGLAHQYGNPANFRVENLYVHDVGADGIDFKVRYGTLNFLDTATQGVFFTNVLIERFGNRLTDCSGLDIRGQVNLTNITVRDFGVAAGKLTGITLSAGINSGADKRAAATKSVLTGFHIEGRPQFQCSGVEVLSTGSVVVSSGTIRFCTDANGGGLWVKPLTATPYGYTPGPVISNVVIEGSMHVHPFVIDRADTTVIGCKVNSEIEYFDARRGNLTNGQTEFSTRFTSGPQTIVMRNSTVLSAGVDYTYTGTTLTLTSPVSSADEVRVVHRSLTGGRLAAPRVSAIGNSTDGFTPMVNLSGPSVANTATLAGNSGASTEPTFSIANVAGAMQVQVTNAGSSNVDIRLMPGNDGVVRFGNYTAESRPVTGYITIKDSAGNARRLAVVD